MGSGYGDSILVQTTNAPKDTYKRRNSTPPFRISLTRQKKSGITRCQLMTTSGQFQKRVRLVKTTGPSLLLISIYRKMIEAIVPVVIALVTGTAVLFNKVNTRVTHLDSKVDRLELKLVESFTSKADFSIAMERMETHLMRIEDKMDKLVDKKCTPYN